MRQNYKKRYDDWGLLKYSAILIISKGAKGAVSYCLPSLNTLFIVLLVLSFLSCDSEDDENVESPIAVINASSQSIKAGESITYTSNSSGIVDRLEWEFTGGDVSNSTSSPVVVTYDTQGSFTVTLRAFNSGGSDEDQLSILVEEGVMENLVQANFTATATNVEVGAEVTFTDTSTGDPTNWNWTFEGGTPSTSTLENPKVTYLSSGIYEVSLTSSNGSSADEEIRAGYITVFDPVIADFTTNVTEITEGDSIDFIDESTNADEWIWSFPGGSPTSSIDQNPTVVYNTAGSYSVTLLAKNSNDEDTIVKENVINVVPAIDTLSNLVAYYRFESNAQNEIDPDNPGIALGGTQYVANRNGKSESAIAFNGTTSYVDIFNPIPNADYTGDITYSFWVNTVSDTTSSSILGLFSSKSRIDITHIDGSIEYTVLFRSNAAATISVTESVAAPVTTNTWVHVAIRHTAEDLFEIFINNELMGREEIARSQIHESSFNSSIGAKYDGSDLIDHFEGLLDELRIYTRALTNDELEALFLAP